MADFFKQFEQAVENVANLAVENAANALEEYPNQADESSALRPTVSLSASFHKKALEYWKGANIEAKRTAWNDKRLEIEQAQRTDRTAPPSAQALKLRLTSSEALLLTLLDLLVEAPDPVHDLADVHELEAKVARLGKEVEKLQGEAGNAVKESEEAKELRDKFKRLESALASSETALKEKSEELEKVVAAQAAINIQELQEREALQAAELSHAQARLVALQTEHERAQNALFELTEKSEEERAAQAAQHELAMAEVERAQQHVAELESLRAQLKHRMGGLINSETLEVQPSYAAVHGLEVMIAAKDHMISQLKDELTQTSTSLRRIQAEADDKIDEARIGLRQAEAKAASLAKEVERLCEPAEVEALQQQVVALASLVDSEMEAEGWMAELGAAHAHKGMIHSWLQERNKKLADEVTSLKRQLTEQQLLHEECARELADARSDLMQKESLVVNLELDLERASSSLSAIAGTDALNKIVGEPGGQSPALAAPGGVRGEESADDLLAIVSGQRDRYRSLLAKSEESLSAAQAELKAALADLEASRADNVCLYEKIRYLESYSHQQARQMSRKGSGSIKVDADGVALPAAPHASRYQCGPLSVSMGEDDGEAELGVGRIGGDSLTRRGLRYQCFGVYDEEAEGGQKTDAEGRYRKEYEQRLNPFSRFKQREANSGITNLPVPDRAVLMGGQLLAGSRMARVFVATYAGVLHLFVFAILYSNANF